MSKDKKRPKILDELEKVSQVLPSPIYWEDVNSIILGGNEAVLRASGALVREAYVGKTLYELYPKKMADNIKRHNEEVMRTGQILSQEEVIEDITTGAIKYFTAIKAPLRDDEGNIIGVIGNSIDITAEKKQQNLRHQFYTLTCKVLSYDLISNQIFYKNEENNMEGAVSADALFYNKILFAKFNPSDQNTISFMAGEMYQKNQRKKEA